MAITEKQIVRVIPSRLASFPPEQSRFLDRRKGMVEEIYVPFGERKAKARVRWQAGDVLVIETAGGGGWGKPVAAGAEFA